MQTDLDIVIDKLLLLPLQLFEGYDDSEIGALDSEDIDGSLQQGSTVLNAIMDEFDRKQTLK